MCTEKMRALSYIGAEKLTFSPKPDIHADRHTYRQIHTDRKTDRPTDRPTDRQTY